MENFTFANPTKIVFGRGSLEKLVDELAFFGKKILLLTGLGSAKRSGLKDSVSGILESAGYKVFELEGIEPNPKLDSVIKAVKIARENKIDFILGLGGGSVIDTAKAVSASIDYQADPWDLFLKKSVPRSFYPIGTILTVAATGSEANGNAVISNPKVNEKRVLYHYQLHPKFSILDPTFTMTVSKDSTFFGVVDIISHILEHYFHKVRFSYTQDRLQEGLMIAVIEAARELSKDLTNYNARANILWSSTIALNGILKTGVKADFSSHQIAHQLSAFYDLPHGSALALVFPNWMRKVFSYNLPKFKQFAKRLFNVDEKGKSDEMIALEGIDRFEKLLREEFLVKTKLSELGIDDKLFNEMSKRAALRSLPDALTPITEELAMQIFRSAL